MFVHPIGVRYWLIAGGMSKLLAQVVEQNELNLAFVKSILMTNITVAQALP